MSKNRILSPLKEIISHQIIGICEKKNAELGSFLENFQQLNNELIHTLEATPNTEKQTIFNISKKYQERKIEKFNNYYAIKGDSIYSLDLDVFRFDVKKIIQSLPKYKTQEQSKNRFYISASDSRFVRSGKIFKLFLYKTSVLPLKMLNFSRKLFKKEVKRIPFWKYSIPYRSLAAYQIENVLFEEIHEVIYDFTKKSIHAVKSALSKEQKINNILIEKSINGNDEKIDHEEFIIDLSRESADLIKNIETLKTKVDQAFLAFDRGIKKSSQISGTFEYPSLFLKYQNRAGKKDSIIKKIDIQNKGWGNTLFGLFEDWKIDQEIYNLNYFCKTEINVVNADYQVSNAEIIDLLEENKKQISETSNKLFTSLGKAKENHAKIIQQSLDGLKQAVDIENFDKAYELLIDHNLPEKINHIELNINSYLQEISTKRWLTKLTDYDRPLKASDLDSFSPRELISFEYYPDLKESCSKLKSKIINHVESQQSELSNIESVIVFNLSSVIESIDKGECDIKDIPKLTSEGMERSQNKIDEIIKSIRSFERNTIQELNHIIHEFNKSTLELTVNENAFNLRMIVMKAKALKRSEEVGIQVWNNLIFYKEKLIRTGKIYLVKGEQLLLPWKKRIGFDGAGYGIATELSDFLLEANQKINSLPIIYQRLYKITPLTEMSFFTGRKSEINQLQIAYDSWKQGKYAPTVIIGEKWSGHTTLINYFITNHPDKGGLLYENRLINIKDEADFLDAWCQILNEKEIGTVEEIIDIINKKHKGKTIIIENIQNYYLRTIDGFENLNLFIKLISKTYKDVFWLFSANIYAWSYLNKTIELSGYFGYQINMNPFSDEELKELIMKKNNISGYKIIFMPSDRNKSSKRFSKLNDEEKQIFLRTQFFNDLNDFAKGNISLALTYWLLSTRNITEDTIEISNFDPPDLSFVGKLNPEKVFIIYHLIMHDGLTLEHLGEVYKKPLDKLYLLIVMLLDDGILIERNNWYEVNPLIYRQSINMLKSKNLIY